MDVFSKDFQRRIRILKRAGVVDIAQVDALLTAIQELCGRQLFKSVFSLPPSQMYGVANRGSDVPRGRFQVFSRAFRDRVRATEVTAIPDRQNLVDTLESVIEWRLLGDDVLYVQSDEDTDDTTTTTDRQMLAAARRMNVLMAPGARQ